MRSLVTSSSRMPRILGAAPALLLMLTLIHVNAWSQPGQPAAPQSSAPVIDVYIDHAWNTLRRSMQDCATLADTKITTEPVLWLPQNAAYLKMEALPRNASIPETAKAQMSP